MTSPQPIRRTGLGRRVADIVRAADWPEATEGVAVRGGPGGLSGLLRGPAVVPLEVVPFAMLVVDVTGGALAVNQRWTDLSGLDREASLGSGWLKMLGHDDRLSLLGAIGRAAEGEPVHAGEYAWGSGSLTATWWLASHERAGETLVGIAVGEPRLGTGRSPAGIQVTAAAGAAAGAAGDPVLAEMPGLLRSVEGLLAVLDRLLDRLPAAEAVPA